MTGTDDENQTQTGRSVADASNSDVPRLTTAFQVVCRIERYGAALTDHDFEFGTTECNCFTSIRCTGRVPVSKTSSASSAGGHDQGTSVLGTSMVAANAPVGHDMRLYGLLREEW